MPKRSNDFQKIILYLQSLASPNYRVEESRFLKDAITGQSREVDIVIESNIAGYHSILSIEVIGWQTKKGDIEWVERMICKHKTLPTSKLVLVSKSGFTKNALKKAKFFNVIALTIEEVLEKEWSEFIDSLRRYEEISSNFVFRIDTKKYKTDTEPPDVDNSKIYTEKDTNQYVGSNAFVDFIINNEQLKDAIFSDIENNSSRNYWAVFQSPTPIYLLEKNGNFREIATINIDIKSTQKAFNCEMSAGSFRDKNVAYGKLSNKSTNAIMTLMKDDDKEKISGYIEDNGGTRFLKGKVRQ